MTEAALATTATPETAPPEIGAAEIEAAARGAPAALDLAALVAARLCHDFISPASAIVSGLDLLEDPSAQDMRDDAMGLIAASARKLVDHLQVCRVAFGASSSAERFDSRELNTLAQGVFAHIRAQLVWEVEPASLSKTAARAALNLAQIAGGALPAGGTATLTATEANGEVALTVTAAGQRARLRAEVINGLRGEPVGDGLAGQWIQAAYLRAMVEANGGSVDFEPGEEQIVFRARTPA